LRAPLDVGLCKVGRLTTTDIRKHQRPSFQPFFHVKEVKHEESAQDIFITAKIIHEMIDRGLFYLESVAIPMTSESSLLSIDLHLTDDRMKPHVRPGFPISGFPRILADGEPLKKSSTCLTFVQGTSH